MNTCMQRLLVKGRARLRLHYLQLLVRSLKWLIQLPKASLHSTVYIEAVRISCIDRMHPSGSDEFSAKATRTFHQISLARLQHVARGRVVSLRIPSTGSMPRWCLHQTHRRHEEAQTQLCFSLMNACVYFSVNHKSEINNPPLIWH